MSWLHDALNAAVASSGSAWRALDDLVLPGWLERRLGWNKRRDIRRLRHVEHTDETPDQGKDATKDW